MTDNDKIAEAWTLILQNLGFKVQVVPKATGLNADERSAVVQHTLSNEELRRICMRCMLVVDEYGNPDSKYYTPGRLLYFSYIPVHERCNHRRGA